MTTPLEDLLHRDIRGWLVKFTRFLEASLGKAARLPEPVVIPDGRVLRPLLARCQAGNDGTLDTSSTWRALWGSDGERVQAQVRGLFHSCNAWKYPPPEKYEALVAALAAHIIKMHETAAEQQVARAAKRAEQKGPAARAHAAKAVLEHVGPLKAALLAYDAASRGEHEPSRWSETAHGLMHLEAAVQRELTS